MAAEDSPVSPGGSQLPPALDAAYERTFAERIEKFLDLDTWHTGEDLQRIYGQLQQQLESNIDSAIAAEDKAAAAAAEAPVRGSQDTVLARASRPSPGDGG